MLRPIQAPYHSEHADAHKKGIYINGMVHYSDSTFCQAQLQLKLSSAKLVLFLVPPTDDDNIWGITFQKDIKEKI